MDQTDPTIISSQATENAILVKLDKKAWKASERPLDENTRTVLENLKSYTNNAILHNLENQKSTNRSKKKSIKKSIEEELENKIIPHEPETSLLVSGDELYVSLIRKELLDRFIKLPEIKSKETKQENTKKSKNRNQKKGISVEQIRQNSLKANLKKDVESVFKSLDASKIDISQSINPSLGLNNRFAELKITTLIVLADDILENNISPAFEEQVYELITGIHRVLLVFSSDKYNISKIALDDLKEYHNKLVIKSGFSFQTLLRNYTRLCFVTKYDYALVDLKIKPYDNQTQLLSYMLEAIKNNFAYTILYRATIGMGKTSMVVPIAEIVRYLRGKDIESKYSLIYACSGAIVRDEIIRYMRQTGVTFGVATYTRTGNFEVKNSWNCKKSSERVAIVADLASTYKLLVEKRVALEKVKELRVSGVNEDVLKKEIKKMSEIGSKSDIGKLIRDYDDLDNQVSSGKISVDQYKSKLENLLEPKYLLFLDEPTVGADIINHPVTKTVARVLQVAPKHLILASATLPDQVQISPILQGLANRHTNLKVYDVVSTNAQLGSIVMDYDANIVLPHVGIKTVQEIGKLISNLEGRPFVDRLYTAPIIYQIYQRMRKEKVQDLPDFEFYFGKFLIINQSVVWDFGLNLFKLLATCSDKVISKVCRPITAKDIVRESKEQAQDQEDQEDIEDDIFEKPIEEIKASAQVNINEIIPEIDLNNIFTCDAHKLLGRCLIAHPNPINFARVVGVKLLADMAKAGIKTTDIINNYMSARADVAKQLDAFEKRKEKKEQKDKVDIKKKEYEDDAKKESNLTKDDHQKVSAIYLENLNAKLRVKFPQKFQINSKQHLTHYAGHITGIDTSITRYPLELAELIYDETDDIPICY